MSRKRQYTDGHNIKPILGKALNVLRHAPKSGGKILDRQMAKEAGLMLSGLRAKKYAIVKKHAETINKMSKGKA